jgi:hypothetical protein
MNISENLTGRLVLYVEDDLTKQYLETLFQLESGWLNIVDVGGNRAVRAMVVADREQGNKQSFGWQDKDFGEDNTAKWGQADTYVFRGTYHEIENYMLDWEAMKGGEKSSDYFPFQQVAHDFAEDMVFVVACWSELRALQRFIGEGFPKQAEIPELKSLDDIVCFIREQHPWIPRLNREFAVRTSEESIRRNVEEKVAQFRDAVAGDSWRTVMPGKEIFRHLLHKAFHGEVDKPSFAKSIADWQRGHQKIPAELQRLIEILKDQRIP